MFSSLFSNCCIRWCVNLFSPSLSSHLILSLHWIYGRRYKKTRGSKQDRVYCQGWCSCCGHVSRMNCHFKPSAVMRVFFSSSFLFPICYCLYVSWVIACVCVLIQRNTIEQQGWNITQGITSWTSWSTVGETGKPVISIQSRFKLIYQKMRHHIQRNSHLFFLLPITPLCIILGMRK